MSLDLAFSARMKQEAALRKSFLKHQEALVSGAVQSGSGLFSDTCTGLHPACQCRRPAFSGHPARSKTSIFFSVLLGETPQKLYINGKGDRIRWEEFLRSCAREVLPVGRFSRSRTLQQQSNRKWNNSSEFSI